MRFVWEDDKNEKNIREHGFELFKGAYVFYDPLRRERYDKKHSDDEDRYQIVGVANCEGIKPIPMLVIVTYPEPDCTRLISARYLEPWERKKFEEED